jgi:hypothetical protein
VDGRLPTHVEVNGLIRAVQGAGGFATVIAKGERDAGTMLIICCENATNVRLYERMPHLDGTRKWTMTRRQDPENPSDFTEYWQLRTYQDSDLWVVELDVANAERFIGLTGTSD